TNHDVGINGCGHTGCSGLLVNSSDFSNRTLLFIGERQSIITSNGGANIFTVDHQVAVAQFFISTLGRHTGLLGRTQLVSSQFGNGDIQSLTSVGANLEGGFERTVQQLTAVEVGFVSGTGNFCNQLFHFRLQSFTVYVRVGRVGRLYGQLAA